MLTWTEIETRAIAFQNTWKKTDGDERQDAQTFEKDFMNIFGVDFRDGFHEYQLRLNAYLADINRQAQERFERLIEGMKQAQGITEQLKAENALEWTGCLNNIRACAREIVEKEIIFA
nr:MULTISPECIES: TnpV protein [Fusobacterium]